MTAYETSTTRLTSTKTSEEQDPALQDRVVAVVDRLDAATCRCPGQAKTVSVRTAPESSRPVWRPMIVAIGSSALRKTWPRVDDPRRQALRASRAHVVLVLHVEDVDARVIRAMIASGIEPSAIAGRIRCLITSQNVAGSPRDDRVEDVEVRRMRRVDQDRLPADGG